MAIMKRVALCLLLVVAACARQDDNPLLAASDDQFIRAIGSLVFLGCDTVLFGREVGSESEAHRESCERGLQIRAADAGISRVVTQAHIADPRVRARYEKLRKV
jgi:hypothetical protein